MFMLKSRFMFSAPVGVKNFNVFKQQYEMNLAAFQSKIQEQEANKGQVKLQKPIKAYVHPLDDKHHRLVFSSVKGEEFFLEAVGPEQVSPHYENFLSSRKYLMSFIAMYMVLQLSNRWTDLAWITKSCWGPCLLLYSQVYFFMESRKQGILPLLSRTYHTLARMEMDNFETHYSDNMRHKIKGMQQYAKGQMDYFNIHQGYDQVKADSINNFLANEYNALQNHLKHRATNILKKAVVYEEQNRQVFIQEILNKARNILEEQVQTKEVLRNSFEIALIGIKNQKMAYDGELLLPAILKTIKSEIQKVDNLTEQQQTDIISLTAQQLGEIKREDIQIKEAFLQKTPPIGNLKEHETVEQIFERWGK